jgi:hypothetical protein
LAYSSRCNDLQSLFYDQLTFSSAKQKSQFYDCSKGKLRFQKGTGSDITNGVLEIEVPYSLNGVDRYTAMDHAVAETQRVLGSSTYNSFDHIMYVMPLYVDFGGAAAFAYIGWYRSVFMNQYASHLQVQVHEFGHNLRMLHSGEDGSTYGDGTGMMGKCIIFLTTGDDRLRRIPASF